MGGAVWFVVGTSYGIVSAIDLVAPEFFNNIPWLVFSRVRPVHVNTVAGNVGELLGVVAPRLSDWLFHRFDRLFPDSAAARGE